MSADKELYKEIGKMQANIGTLTETSARIEKKLDRLVWRVAGTGGLIGSIVTVVITLSMGG